MAPAHPMPERLNIGDTRLCSRVSIEGGRLSSTKSYGETIMVCSNEAKLKAVVKQPPLTRLFLTHRRQKQVFTPGNFAKKRKRGKPALAPLRYCSYLAPSKYNRKMTPYNAWPSHSKSERPVQQPQDLAFRPPNEREKKNIFFSRPTSTTTSKTPPPHA